MLSKKHMTRICRQATRLSCSEAINYRTVVHMLRACWRPMQCSCGTITHMLLASNQIAIVCVGTFTMRYTATLSKSVFSRGFEDRRGTMVAKSDALSERALLPRYGHIEIGKFLRVGLRARHRWRKVYSVTLSPSARIGGGWICRLALTPKYAKLRTPY